MADQQAQPAPAAAAGVAPAVIVGPPVVIDRDSSKIPTFSSEPTSDGIQAEYWVDRIERLRIINNWNDQQTVFHAINALRGDAIHILKHFKFVDVRAGSSWIAFKPQFLKAFGKVAQDTSNIANLFVTQKAAEPVPKYAHRVSVTLDEFCTSLSTRPLDEPDWTILTDPEMQALAADDRVVRFGTLLVRHHTQLIIHGLAKTMFINGLDSKLQMLVRQTNPTNLADAETQALKVQRDIKGPLDHVLGLEKSGKGSQAINFVKRGSNFRGRGGYPIRGRGKPMNGGASSAANGNSKGTDCWYCRLSGHVQRDCRKRIARGAPPVRRPRTVQEITADDVLCQEIEPEYDDQDDDHHDYDDQLQDAFTGHEEEEHEELIQSLHLN